MVRVALFALTLLAGSSLAMAQQGLPPSEDKPPVNAAEYIPDTPRVFTLSSTTLQNDQAAPKSFEGNQDGCNGDNSSPALEWSGEPVGTGSFALTVFDPDAKPSGFMHWVLLKIPADSHSLVAGAGDPAINALPSGTIETANSAGVSAFSGACPPVGSGPHHYEITLYAMPAEPLDIPTSTVGIGLASMLNDKALATVRLTPTYERK